MTLLVDTSVWSLAFRRNGNSDVPTVDALRAALAGGDPVVTTGLILQELLQGFSGPRARKKIVERFAALPLLIPDRRDYMPPSFAIVVAVRVCRSEPSTHC